MISVVPYVGTWIEMLALASLRSAPLRVVPYVGTWIEIMRGESVNKNAQKGPT